MADTLIPVVASYTGSDVTGLRELATGEKLPAEYLEGTVIFTIDNTLDPYPKSAPYIIGTNNEDIIEINNIVGDYPLHFAPPATGFTKPVTIRIIADQAKSYLVLNNTVGGDACQIRANSYLQYDWPEQFNNGTASTFMVMTVYDNIGWYWTISKSSNIGITGGHGSAISSSHLGYMNADDLGLKNFDISNMNKPIGYVLTYDEYAYLNCPIAGTYSIPSNNYQIDRATHRNKLGFNNLNYTIILPATPTDGDRYLFMDIVDSAFWIDGNAVNIWQNYTSASSVLTSGVQNNIIELIYFSATNLWHYREQDYLGWLTGQLAWEKVDKSTFGSWINSLDSIPIPANASWIKIAVYDSDEGATAYELGANEIQNLVASYDNSTSGLTATSIKGGIDELSDSKSEGNPGISAKTPITEADLSFDTTSRVLTITPPLGYFDFYVDGGGVVTKFRKTGTTIDFPAITDTTGIWYFHFDNNGDAISTQTPWTSFNVIATVLRIYWNATLTGANKLQVLAVEYHQNTISAVDHEWKHRYGTIWVKGFDAVHNALASGSPATDGSNTVFSLKTGTNLDDNLEYTITNGTGAGKFEQDLGHITAGTLTASNSGQFKIRNNDSSGRLAALAATRFPFPWNSGSNLPQYITTAGVRTDVSNNYYFVCFAYSIQDYRNGEPIKIAPGYAEYSTITAARAVTWSDLQATYPTLADNEIRPLYKLIFEHKTSYDAACKYSALRQVDDYRKTIVTTTATAVGNIPASNVTNTPSGDIASLNIQDTVNELDTDKLAKSGGTLTNYKETRYAVTTSGNVTLDLANGNVQRFILDAARQFTMPADPGDIGQSFVLIIECATYTPTWNTSPVIEWLTSDGAAPTLVTASNLVNVLTFIWDDTDTRWLGFLAGKETA